MAGSNYLLDTNCLIWFQENNPRIADHIMKVIQEPENVIYFSQISLFEISIKQAIDNYRHFLRPLKKSIGKP